MHRYNPAIEAAKRLLQEVGGFIVCLPADVNLTSAKAEVPGCILSRLDARPHP
jgi:hypothetical protein